MYRVSSTKPLESWLVFFNPAQLDLRISFDLTQHISTSDYCYGLALDGGLHRAEQLNLSVHWHIGDFDSVSVISDDIEATLSWEKLTKLSNTNPHPALMTRYSLPLDKDFIDGEVVLEILKTRNIKHILFFDFWQGRWDFSLLHFMWLLNNNWMVNKLTIILPEGYCKLTSGSQTFEAVVGSSFSIFPIDLMEEVKLSGSMFDGDSYTFKPGTGHSFSNKFICNRVDLEMKNDSRYLFFIFNEGDVR